MKKDRDEAGSPEKTDGENSGTAMRPPACGTQSIEGTLRE